MLSALRWTVRTIASIAFCSLSCFLALPADAATAWATAALPAPPEVADPVGAVGPLSCASPGNCSAVVSYDDSAAGRRAMLFTQTAGSWGPGVRPFLPAGSATEPYVELNSISCASPGNCSAVGDYLDRSGSLQGLLLSESAGVWGPGEKVVFPADAGTDPYIELRSVSCASPGYCSAVGAYTNNSGKQQGLVINEAAGAWGPGADVALPPGGTTASLSSVSCPAPEACTAVGFYASATQSFGLLVTESMGTWAAGTAAALPPGGESGGGLKSVSCPAIGDCSAVGNYTGANQQAESVVMSQVAGSWTASVEVKLPAPAQLSNSDLFSVSCPTPGNCAAVGFYDDHFGNEQGLLVSESGGTWGSGAQAPLPANANAVSFGPMGTSVAVVQDVSCPAAGSCYAVGFYSDIYGNNQGLLLSESSGRWAAAVEASPPQSVGTRKGGVSVTSLSCAGAGRCEVGGSYYGLSGKTQALVIKRSGGRWSGQFLAGVPGGAPWEFDATSASCSTAAGDCTFVGEARPPASPAGEPSIALPIILSKVKNNSEWVKPRLPAGARAPVELNSVSCPSAGNCAAVGSYIDASGAQQALLLLESSGRWQKAKPVGLPPDGSAPELASVSCPSPGNCTAVGHYEDASGKEQALVLSQASGSPTTTEVPSLPGARGTVLTSVSCSSAGDCTAVGADIDRKGPQLIFVEVESSGDWGKPSRPLLPLGTKVAAKPPPWLSSVSCSSPGNCTAVGSYVAASGEQQGMLLEERGGTWGRATTAPTPRGQSQVSLTSVSCDTQRDCLAVGWYTGGNTQWGLLLNKSRGIWQVGTKAPLPPVASGFPSAYLSSVSCRGGHCAAVGTFVSTTSLNYGVLLTGPLP